MLPNYDEKTGIHYGVISMHSIPDAWGEAEPVYFPVCPDCQSELKSDPTEEEYSNANHAEELFSADYYCKKCNLVFDASDVLPDEPAGFIIKTDDVEAQSCLDTDVMVTKSPYYTYARPCSPCVPNAGDLNTASPGETSGFKTYCFDHTYFPDGIAPYDVYIFNPLGGPETILKPGELSDNLQQQGT